MSSCNIYKLYTIYIGIAIFVSTLLDIETYLANMSDHFGGFFAGLYIVLLCFMSYIAIVYAHYKHKWKNFHFYGIIDEKNIHKTNPYINTNEISDINHDDIVDMTHLGIDNIEEKRHAFV